MKQLILATGFWPTKSNPITGIFVVQQAKAYQKLGYDVAVVAPQPVPQCAGFRAYYEEVDGLGVYSPYYPNIPQRFIKNRHSVHFNTASCGFAVSRQLKRIGWSSLGCVHVHGIRYAGLSLPQWRKYAKGPLILTLHGVDPYLEQNAAVPWMRSLINSMCRYVDSVTLVGSPLKTYSANLGIPGDKVSVVPNGNDLPWKPIQTSTQRPVTGKRVVLSVSNLAKLKGIDLNLKALGQIVSSCPRLDWEYRVVGEGPERQNLEALAADLGIQNRVHFLGRLPYTQTMKEMADCDVFSLPSWGDAFGIVYLEAMARSRPVLGCLGWGAEEVIRQEMDGFLVPEKDASKLAEALEKLLLDPDLCRRMGRSGCKRAQAFTWERNARSHLDRIS